MQPGPAQRQGPLLWWGPPEAQLLLCPILVGTCPSVPLKSALSPEEKRSCPLHNLVMLTAQPVDRGNLSMSSKHTAILSLVAVFKDHEEHAVSVKTLKAP